MPVKAGIQQETLFLLEAPSLDPGVRRDDEWNFKNLLQLAFQR